MTAQVNKARLLWDGGGLWSVMTWQTCRGLGLPLMPILAEEVAADGLRGAELLVVPGGWPSRKKRALGDKGREALHDFIRQGGRYLGICGGAGLALKVDDGLGLVDLDRAKGNQRLPSASGPILAQATEEGLGHPLWQGVDQPARLNVWWPGQFAATAGAPVTVLARYGEPCDGFCCADIRLDQTSPLELHKMEEQYGMRLDPAVLCGRPAVVQAELGQGELVLSYLHFDTPGSSAGARCLANLWRHWLGIEAREIAPRVFCHLPVAKKLAEQAEALWQQGLALGLWEPRHRSMPLWRRGARGLEVWSLVVLCRALAAVAGPGHETMVRALENELVPVWELGPGALAAQAAELQGLPPDDMGRDIQERWFPVPRRTGGELATALESLEAGLGKILAAPAGCD
jgi:hypothetical protein